jgi:hypothetical protein
LPKFLGGAVDQVLSRLSPAKHREFHSLLIKELKAAGLPLPVGGVKGSTQAWARYFAANPGSQRKAFDAVLSASRAIDAKYGTSITQDVWRSIMGGAFKPYP